MGIVTTRTGAKNTTLIQIRKLKYKKGHERKLVILVRSEENFMLLEQ